MIIQNDLVTLIPLTINPLDLGLTPLRITIVKRP